MKHVGEAVDESVYPFYSDAELYALLVDSGLRAFGSRLLGTFNKDAYERKVYCDEYQSKYRYHESDVTDMADAILGERLYEED